MDERESHLLQKKKERKKEIGRPIFTEKIKEIQNWGGKFLKVGEVGIKRLFKQRVSFRRISVTRNTMEILYLHGNTYQLPNM